MQTLVRNQEEINQIIFLKVDEKLERQKQILDKEITKLQRLKILLRALRLNR